MAEDMKESMEELTKILKGIQEELDRAVSLADEISETTDVQVLSSVEVVQYGVKSAMRELPDS